MTVFLNEQNENVKWILAEFRNAEKNRIAVMSLKLAWVLRQQQKNNNKKATTKMKTLVTTFLMNEWEIEFEANAYNYKSWFSTFFVCNDAYPSTCEKKWWLKKWTEWDAHYFFLSQMSEWNLNIFVLHLLLLTQILLQVLCNNEFFETMNYDKLDLSSSSTYSVSCWNNSNTKHSVSWMMLQWSLTKIVQYVFWWWWWWSCVSSITWQLASSQLCQACLQSICPLTAFVTVCLSTCLSLSMSACLSLSLMCMFSFSNENFYDNWLGFSTILSFWVDAFCSFSKERL